MVAKTALFFDGDKVMAFSGSHDREQENSLAKAYWFQSLTLEERMEIFCEMTDLTLENNPDIVKKKLPHPIRGRVQVISLP